MIERMHIRKAERRDLEALGKLAAMLVRTHYAFDHDRFLAPIEGTGNAYGAFLGRSIDSDDACLFVAVAVAEEARRSGVATKLIETAVARLRDHGAPRVILGTAGRNIEMTLELNK
jgi:GNAT superfamily N-acetyltransferase